MKFNSRGDLLAVFGRQHSNLVKMYASGFYPRVTIQGYLVPPETFEEIEKRKGRGILSVPRLELTHDLEASWNPDMIVVRPLEGVHEDSCKPESESFHLELRKEVENSETFVLSNPLTIIDKALSRDWRFFWKGRWKATRVYGFNEDHPSVERLEKLQKKGQEDTARVGVKPKKSPLSYESEEDVKRVEERKNQASRKRRRIRRKRRKNKEKREAGIPLVNRDIFSKGYKRGKKSKEKKKDP